VTHLSGSSAIWVSRKKRRAMAMGLFHRALASPLFLFTPGSVRPQVPDNPSAQHQEPPDPSTTPESSPPKTKKIWTDDNLSSDLKLVSENPKAGSVGEEEMPTSFGPGTTSITAAYTPGAQTMPISVPASVTVSDSSFILTPRSLDFGDQQVGTTSCPQQGTLTNHTTGSITIYKFEIRA